MNKTFDITTRLRGDGTGNYLFIVMMQNSDHNTEISDISLWRAKHGKHLKEMISKCVYNEKYSSISKLSYETCFGRTQMKKIGKFHYHPSTPGIDQ